MNYEELKKLLFDHSQEWRDGFFAAVNLTSESKASFLKLFIGEEITVCEISKVNDGDDQRGI